MKNPLLDVDFLQELDRTQNKEVFVEIFALNLDGEILESIEGHVTQGSINIDGASSMRRTCSLTIVADELNIHEYYWGLHTKFKLSLGLKNEINSEYPEIIWFKQGEFVITAFSTTQGISNYTISIQGKDKMALLNGELGGTIPSLTWDFGTVQTVNKYGDTIKEKVLIKDIIIGAVHQFAKEPLYKIIVNDLEDVGLELLEYRSKDPMYIIINYDSQEVENLTLDGSVEYYNPLTKTYMKVSEVPVYNHFFDLEQQKIMGSTYEPTILWSNEVMDERLRKFTIAKIEYGMTAGYRETPLVFPGDLILQVGQSVTMLLDQIVATLGDFEYFFDLDGNFIFQRKPTYVNLSWNNIKNNLDEKYVENAAFSSALSYTFEDGVQVISYSNNPNFANLRNDFTVWGARQGVGGAAIPIHMRFAVDQKPDLFVNYEGVHYTTKTKEQLEDFIRDWNQDDKPPFYVKKKNPRGLSEDWWDIFDWANYYQLCTGYLPNEIMGKYLSNGGVQFTEEVMYSMFPKGDYTTTYFVTNPVYLFDVEADGTLGYTNHGTACTLHRYKDYFLDTLSVRNATAYIYKPEMPIDLPESDYIEVPQLEVKTDLDWRELIYQMAKDYNRHHLDEDYYVKLANNNYGRYMNNKTGYEQYYTDLEGFWRQLYCPAEEAETTYEQIYPTRKTYLEEYKNYLYDIPNFIQDPEEPFHSGIDYYSYQWDANKDVETMQKVIINKQMYEEEKSKYWWINPAEPYKKESCHIIEPYRSSGFGYYDEEGNPIISQVTYPDYAGNEKNYYYKKGEEYLPCAHVDIYVSNRTYFIVNPDKQPEGMEMIKQLTRSQYEAEPSKYFYREYQYFQCNDGDQFIEEETYYKKAYNRTTDVEYYAKASVISKEIFENNPSTFYTRSEEYGYINCVRDIRAFNENDKYKLRSVLPDGQVLYTDWDHKNNEGLYKIEAGKGFLYYTKASVESCDHPLSYDLHANIYKTKETIYDSSGWVKDLTKQPESLNFWFDFLEENDELQKYSNQAIGNRPKAINDTQVKAIYFRETPTAIFVEENEWDNTSQSRLGYTYLNLPYRMESLFSISGQGKSAKAAIDQLVYQFAQNAENINLTALPVYYLEPNTRIFIRNDESGLGGEYIINRINITLGSNGNMTIGASKAIERLF